MELSRRAAHEAGHLTFALVLGWTVSGAGVEAGDHGLGGVLAKPPRTEHEMVEDIPGDGVWASVVAEYEGVILEHAAGAAGERLVFGTSLGEGNPRQENSDWGLVLYLLDTWNKAPDRPALRFGDAAPFTAAVEAAQAWLRLEPHLQLFHHLRRELETQRSLTSADCESIRQTFLAGGLRPA
ncbi:hypothetical protein [Deinococcus soli (ex Cha et al. 2016)]|uniref:Uncharacterized protein n=2 Tax=Deinococcus soli (ex Cha et al. 2016) TaxID=1309411 RepID=A0ACC6KHW8_9DEIO|nr:hypothetical protein [Deinococcus soli (ex Cha et al. 2016)]MDR6219219.1 hypothetical protein [Deinococcus soli (ex Cha et al. 2016)]MDR6329468.1 hypothetical protein [Deinococcus soli (ex Cha et al. 2016)]MDR6752128.1 hypothetical protein [Deinococcus soli (ex Cha et al. 2016)]